MKSPFRKYWRTVLTSLVISIFTVMASSAVLADPPPPAGAPASGDTPVGTVTQPKIIPEGGTDTAKLYLPHDTSNVGNKTYIQNSLLPGIAATIIGFTGGLALLFVVISGIQYLTAYGDPGIADKAKKTLTYALVGLILAGLSYAIVAIIATINVTAST